MLVRTHAFIVYRSLTRLNPLLSILTLYPVSPIILNEHTLRQRGRGFDRGDRRQAFLQELQSPHKQPARGMQVEELQGTVRK